MCHSATTCSSFEYVAYVIMRGVLKKHFFKIFWEILRRNFIDILAVVSVSWTTINMITVATSIRLQRVQQCKLIALEQHEAPHQTAHILRTPIIWR